MFLKIYKSEGEKRELKTFARIETKDFNTNYLDKFCRKFTISMK